MIARLHRALWPVLLFAGSVAAQDIGIRPTALRAGPFRFDTAEQHDIRVDVVVRGLAHPFSFAMLPGGDALIVERGMRLRHVRGAVTDAAELLERPVGGTPEPASVRGAGLHDIALHPQFEQNRLVYFTYNRPGIPDPDAEPGARAPTALTLARARFDGTNLVAGEDIFVGGEIAGGSGSRIAFDGDGMVYITSGAPFTDDAQRPDNVYGKVLRIRDDGSIPSDNPFTNVPGARGEVYSLGHRDQLGLTVHESGAVLAAEHGPNGGDEVNLILPGRNYGWPNYSFGRTYEGPRISEVPLGPDTEQPLLLWIPSIAPTGMTFYTGERLPAWTGNLFIGSARRGEIPRTGGLERVVLNDNLEELRRETLLSDLHQRIRDVRQGPDGLLYVVTDEDDGALLRIGPAPR